MIRTTNVTLLIRHDTAFNWSEKNPILLPGEFGLETDTLLFKIGNGINNWISLSYINKLDPTYLQHQQDGTITFSSSFQEKIQSIIDKLEAPLIITNDPVAATDPVNKAYVDAAISVAGLLKHQIVNELPTVANANEHTIYMIHSNDHYEEYMLIDGQFNRIGGSDSTLTPATGEALGGVMSSNADNHISVTQQGFMTLNRVSTSLLYVPDGDDLVVNGGGA